MLAHDMQGYTFLDFELELQRLALRHGDVIKVFNHFYAWMHFVEVKAFFGWLLWRRYGASQFDADYKFQRKCVSLLRCRTNLDPRQYVCNSQRDRYDCMARVSVCTAQVRSASTQSVADSCAHAGCWRTWDSWTRSST